MAEDENRFTRQVALFGPEGQRKIRETRALIVGLGGLGSHLAQQLTFLGVPDDALVDHDIITGSSRNRVVGSRPADVEEKTPKVDVAERLILEIDPDATVATYPVKLEQAHEAFADRTVVFGCVDNDLVRLQLTELAARHHLPYFDLASDTGIDNDGEPTYGGRIVFCDGSRCLHCLGLLDQEDIRRASLPEDARRAHDEVYGIKQSALGETGPAVVSVNGVVAALAVTELMGWITGIREPAPQLVYYGEKRLVRRSTDQGDPNCAYCHLWRT
ncbi:MAG TPA: ThiF family adenylyltransferase [Gaiellaceae bacterium]|jgi:molybdopterin/thiamine biosynthesis adenylyltransferase|nr:ThiF family adenylyltransferase [Gaiellaceae bacterium]